MGLEHWFYTLPLRLRSIFLRRDVERELSEELEYHLERRIAEGTARGMSLAEAQSRAKRKMDGLEQRKEECRDMRKVRFIEDLLQDLRYAGRTLRRGPVFAAVAVLSLALGIGANTAIFSVIDALLLRVLPVERPEELVEFRIDKDSTFSYPTFEVFRDSLPLFSGMTAIWLLDRSNVAIDGRGEDPGMVSIGLVSGTYFSTLGVNTAIGRSFTAEEDRIPGGHPVAVISNSYWERRFARSQDVVGRTLRLSGTVYTILGVAAAGFSSYFPT